MSTTPAAAVDDQTVTDRDLTDVRVLIEDALRYYASTGDATVAGVSATDLAENVRGWTHTTRLRDFVEAARKAAV